MRAQSQKTPPRPTATLLVFTRGAVRERARRRLLPRRLGHLEVSLHRRGLETAVAAGRQAGCRVVVSSPGPLELPGGVERLPQRGHGFAERLETAMAEAFARYGGPVVVVGTDAPLLGADHLLRAIAVLRREPGSVVLGPATDGGFYLLAASAPLAVELAATAWCRSDTLRTLRDRLRETGRRSLLLEPLTDLDRPSDLAAWLGMAHRRGSISAMDPAWWSLLRILRRALAALICPGVVWRIGSPLACAVAGGWGRSPPAAS